MEPGGTAGCLNRGSVDLRENPFHLPEADFPQPPQAEPDLP